MADLKQNLMGSIPASDNTGLFPATASQASTNDGQPDAFVEKYGYSWDLVVVFPTDKDCKTSIALFHQAGIETYMYYSVQKDEVYCKLRAPVERLARQADDLDHKMLMDETRLMVAVEAGYENPKIAGRSITHDPLITPYRPYQLIHGKYDTDERLATMYATCDGLTHPFRTVERLKLLINIIEAKGPNCCGINVHHQLKHGEWLAFFPLHDDARRARLLDKWLTKWSWPHHQPFDEIRDYFGEKIALYFVFVGHYTTWLISLSIVGLIVSLDVLIELSCDAVLIPYMCIFVSFWSVLMLEYWKRREAVVSMEWGMADFEDQERDRAQFRGTPMVSFIDGSQVTYYPPEERGRRRTLGNIVIVTLILVVLGFIASIFALKIYLTYDISNSFFNDTGSYIGSFLNSFQIQIMNYVYQKVAVWLTDKENHRSDTHYEDSLLAKLFCFQFVNSYASLFYVAFVQEYVDPDGCTGGCMFYLCESLGIIFCTRLLTANLVEIYLPRWQAKQVEKEERKGVPEGTLFSQAELEFACGTYDPMMGPLEDMSELSIQFGYVTLFVSGFPLAPALALISNYMEIRIDAWKISHECRRPVPRGAQDIGTWQVIWTITALAAVVTNAGIVFFTSTVYDDWSSTAKVWGFIAGQYFVFVCMGLFSYFVDDIPESVTIQLKRQAFITAKVVDQVADEEEEEFDVMSPRRAAMIVLPTDDQPPPQQDRIHFSWTALH